MTNNTESREVDWSWLWENLKEWRTHNKGGTENLVTVSDSLLGKLSLELRKGQSQSSQIQDLKDEIERLREKLLPLEHLERTAMAWAKTEEEYCAHKGCGRPYSEEFSELIEARIFNAHALKEAAKHRALSNKEG